MQSLLLVNGAIHDGELMIKTLSSSNNVSVMMDIDDECGLKTDRSG